MESGYVATQLVCPYCSTTEISNVARSVNRSVVVQGEPAGVSIAPLIGLIVTHRDGRQCQGAARALFDPGAELALVLES